MRPGKWYLQWVGWQRLNLNCLNSDCAELCLTCKQADSNRQDKQPESKHQLRVFLDGLTFYFMFGKSDWKERAAGLLVCKCNEMWKLHCTALQQLLLVKPCTVYHHITISITSIAILANGLIRIRLIRSCSFVPTYHWSNLDLSEVYSVIDRMEPGDDPQN